MDSLENGTARYRESVEKLLAQYMQDRPHDQDVETQFIQDTKNQHFQIINVGWEGEHRVYSCVLHIDIKGDKVWIQRNMTEHLVAEDLVESGVPKEHIVLGFHSPSKRRYTNFAVN